MKTVKKLLLIVFIALAAGIVLQLLGYIDSPLFRWFTEIQQL